MHSLSQCSIQKSCMAYYTSVRSVGSLGHSATPPDGQIQPHWYTKTAPAYKTREELVDDLRKRIIHEDEHLLVIDKPFGLPMHGLKYDENTSLSEANYNPSWGLIDLVCDVCEGKVKEHLTQNRMHSGITVFSKSTFASGILEKYFKHCKASYNPFLSFRAVVLGKVESSSEVKPELFWLERKQINHKLVPIVVQANKTRKKARQQIQVALQVKSIASTSLDDTHSGKTYDVSLIDIVPSSIRWNAVELFLLHKFSPILGDHIFSNRLGFLMGRPHLKDINKCVEAPQVLPPPLLNILGISDEETLLIPLHLHAHKAIIPDLRQRKRSEFTVEAPLPAYFTQTMERLRLEE
ncbi:hypothetical protein CAPTEDRAFT_213460 [Capitella teleta]|uniref:Pseudouridine synthase RsuA/RluA-like domain-containing protein n=1 Tax=Capitella teleta TaxID=283909 RepID=R7T8U5_CAPTE|nr:hypothetical protein CAPTEDRAFT_213460 [Capitella teleta]|eukprot:ELT90163.1 hypothetical protein CAPTEDRAFT_213460 [Capitella teleta]